MANKDSQNPLILTGSPPTTLNVQIHPLVLLTITDYITRHTLRSQDGPVIGAIIGQQNGRSFTLEHAFECKLAITEGIVGVDSEWFTQRLEQYREVHKEPAMDLVAMFTMGPVDGPQEVHLPMLKQVQELTSADAPMLLLFHPGLVNELQGGKLPISLYESTQEQEGEQTNMRFKELTFEVETGEAEMIGVDFVAKGGGNATAVPKTQTSAPESSSKDKSKGKGKAKERDSEEADTNGTSNNILSPEDEELIASLTTKANAIKMLNQRINLIRAYLADLPASYLTDASSSSLPPDTTNHSVLRSVNAMLSRLPLLAPPTAATTQTSTTNGLQAAAAKEKQDVHLTSLLAALTRSVAEAQTMGSKFHIVQREKASKERTGYGGGGAGRNPRDRMGFGDDGHGLLMGDSPGGF